MGQGRGAQAPGLPPRPLLPGTQRGGSQPGRAPRPSPVTPRRGRRGRSSLPGQVPRSGRAALPARRTHCASGAEPAAAGIPHPRPQPAEEPGHGRPAPPRPGRLRRPPWPRRAAGQSAHSSATLRRRPPSYSGAEVPWRRAWRVPGTGTVLPVTGMAGAPPWRPSLCPGGRFPVAACSQVPELLRFPCFPLCRSPYRSPRSPLVRLLVPPPRVLGWRVASGVAVSVPVRCPPRGGSGGRYHRSAWLRAMAWW